MKGGGAGGEGEGWRVTSRVRKGEGQSERTWALRVHVPTCMCLRTCACDHVHVATCMCLRACGHVHVHAYRHAVRTHIIEKRECN